MTSKRCYYCKEIKSFEDFNKNKARKDWLKSECRTCQAKIKKEYKKTYNWTENEVKN